MSHQWTSKDVKGYITYLQKTLYRPGPQPTEKICAVCHKRQIIFSRNSMIRHIEEVHLPEALRNDPYIARSATLNASGSHDERAKAHEDFNTACTVIYPPTTHPCQVILKYSTPTEPAWVCGYVGGDVAAVRRHEKLYHNVDPQHAPPSRPIYWRDDTMPHYRVQFDGCAGPWVHPNYQQYLEGSRDSSVESTPSPITPPSPPLPPTAATTRNHGSPAPTPATPWYENESPFIRELFGGEIKLFTEGSLFKSRERLPPPVVDIRYLHYVRVFSPFA